jgi:hypothetical protein
LHGIDLQVGGPHAEKIEYWQQMYGIFMCICSIAWFTDVRTF